MKKAVLFIAALLMIGSMAFAMPNVSVGMWGRTTFALAAGSTDPANTGVYQGWGPDWGTYYWDWNRHEVVDPPPGTGADALIPGYNWTGRGGPRMGFQVDTTGDKAEWHMKIRIDSNQVTQLSNAYGVLKFIPDLLTVNVGYICGDGVDNFRKNSPNAVNDVHNSNIGRMAGWGIWIIVAPKDTGFEAVVQWQTPIPGAESGNSKSWKFIGSVHYNENWDIGGMLLNTNIAASYKIPDIMKITLGTVLVPASEGNWGLYPAQTQRNIFGRIELLMVEGLILWVDGRYWGMENSTSNMNFVLGAGYKLDALNIMLGVVVGINPAGDISFDIEPDIEYGLGDITLGFAASIAGSSVSGANLKVNVFPYVALLDGAFRAGFEYTLNTVDTADFNYWCIPLILTFSFW